MKKILLTLAVALGCTTVQAANWKMSVELPDSNYIAENAKLFAQEIKEATDNELTIDVSTNSVLLTRPELKRGVQQGIVPLGEMLVSALGNEDAIFEVDNVPFLASSFDQSQKLWEASRPLIEEKFARQGLILVYGTPYPPQGIYTKKPVNTLKDIEGIRFRAYNATTSNLAKMMGTVPTTVQPQEVPQAFSTGVIDGMLTSPATGVDTQAWDYVKYYYDAQVFIPQSVVIANKRAFDRLPQEVQEQILEAGKRAEARGWEMAREDTAKLTNTLAENGLEVLELPEQLAVELHEIGNTMTEQWAKKAGAEGQSLLESYQQ